MSTREKIILCFVILAVGYAAYNFLAATPKIVHVETEDELTNLKKLTADVVEEVSRAVLTKTEAFIIGQAGAEWKRDPFLKPGLPVKFEPESGRAEVSAEKARFTYSGYLEMADKKLAIINGIEYKAGEIIVNGGGYIVGSISPTRVALELTGGKNVIILPLEEVNVPLLDKTR
ncbi:MAG TPA: hypothetical protein VMW78_06860 [Anaerolineae bacterium]|nr:hypothetical protein [Anaerolineae bacterium]